MEELVFTLNSWMQGSFGIALAGSLAWGLVSVLLCPCHIAAIPLIIGYVGGQDGNMDSRKGGRYALLFSLGLIITITVIGTLCALLGRILGDISPYWALPVGLIIIILGLSLTGAFSIPVPTAWLKRMGLGGAIGALILGLLYGLLSGACTFGFVAPILAVITLQGMVFKGSLLVLAFAVGHCLPIMVAGFSTPLVGRILESSGLRAAGRVGRILAGCLVVAVGAYVMTSPFFH